MVFSSAAAKAKKAVNPLVLLLSGALRGASRKMYQRTGETILNYHMVSPVTDE